MLYREVGEFKTSYAADQQTFPISFDKIAYFIALAIAFFVVPLVINDYWAKAILLPFLIFGIAAIGLNMAHVNANKWAQVDLSWPQVGPR